MGAPKHSNKNPKFQNHVSPNAIVKIKHLKWGDSFENAYNLLVDRSGVSMPKLGPINERTCEYLKIWHSSRCAPHYI